MNRYVRQGPAFLLGIALSVSAVHVSCAQAASSPTQALLAKAHTLESRGRMDMAAQTWQQVLLAEPNNTEALAGLARAAKLAGNEALAGTYIQRLRSINPNDPGIAKAEQTTSQTSQNAQLQRAGKLAEQGDYTQAMTVYRQIFGTEPPAGDWALAYYETEAATDAGKQHAAAGLRALASKYPLDSRYQVALGRILTYDPRTRAEGRRYLQRYPDSADAREALRLAAVWDSRKSGGPSSGTASNIPAAPSALQLAYTALNAKRYEDAEKRFQAILAREPRNGRALAGMGYVRMDQQNFSGAISYLEQARAEGVHDAALERNLESSLFFYVLEEGGKALNGNDLLLAEQKYREALRMKPGSPEALLGLGGTLLKAGQPKVAVPIMQQVIQAAPVLQGYRGLFAAQYESGDPMGALETERAFPAAIRAQLFRDPEYLRTLAGAYSDVGREQEAQRVLRTALDLPFPENGSGIKSETRLQYASLLLQANRNEQAAGLYRQVLAEDAKNVPAWQGLIAAEHAQQNDAASLQSIESMPPAVYDQALRNAGFLSVVAAVYQANGKLDLAQSLLDRAVAARTSGGQAVPPSVQVQLAGLYLQRSEAARALPIYQSVLHEHPDRMDAWRGLVNAMHALGRDRDASTQMPQIPASVRAQLENNADYLQVAAEVYSALGQKRLAQVYVERVRRSYALQHTQPPASVEIQNAWLMYNGMNDSALYQQLLALGSRSDLSDDQRRTVQTIWAQWAVRRASQATAANQQKRALAILNAAASSFPDNPAVIKALGGGYVQAGMPKEAINIFKNEDMTSASASDYRIAVGAALAGNDLQDAEAWLRYGLVQYPQDGGLLRLAAKFEQARGDNGKAEEYYKAALAVLPADRVGTDLTSLLRQPLNPRGLPAPAQPQDLASLLAPANESSAAEAARPYLPSYADESVSGVPFDSDSVARPSVPSSLRNPAPGQERRLRDYTPPGASLGNGAVEGLPSAGPGFSKFDLPAEIATPVSSEQAQHERILQASQAAAASIAPDLPSTNVAYGPFIPYVAPAFDSNAAITYEASDIYFPTTIIYTEFPSSETDPNVLRNATAKGEGRNTHAQDAAAEAAEIRRHQSDPGFNPTTGTTGVSSPPDNGDLLLAQNTQSDPLTTPPPGQIPRPGSGAGDPAGRITNGQQYPLPIRRAQTAAARRRMRRRPSAVAGFGPGSAPVFYPELPTDMNSQPYPDMPQATAQERSTPTDDDLIARSLPPLRGSSVAAGTNGYPAGGPPLTERQQTERDLATLEASYSGWVGGSAITRVRSGEPGIDRLQDYEIPMEATVVAGKSARFSVIPKAVFLTSGTIDSSRYGGNFIPYLGTLPANAANTPSAQYASGIGGEIQMTTQNFGLAVGYTPYEFLVHNVTGRLRYRPAGGPFTIFGERDSVKQTQLSYAGLRDPGTITLASAGNIWGGVVSTGGGVRFDHGNERAGFYLSAAGSVLTGYHTLANSSVEGTGGAYFRIHQFPGYGTLNIGGNMFAQHFAHNERALTYGNGGYFSPNVYFLGNIPVTFTGNYKSAWHYSVEASIGVQTFQESYARYFPLPEDAARQNQAYSGCTLQQIAQHTCTSAELAANSNIGANFGINAQGSYRLTEHWYAGFALAANNTNNFNLVQPTVFLRYMFRPQVANEDYPTGLFPVDGLRPLRVP